ncbi:conserved membrane hypothetical protein [Cupriavidus taiwanensis]|uniref:hypothetical protein n=1 Tax=Cupriavidus taiwanensis TaxID=164546 RepID=UPI000E191499|nr:hypothetical protein [Cupriavidus taiwanensis]SOZ14457.1 conserved membrane hypothetical protein [Cupriavidus taiwanensis]SOZ25874.1 conserved membrane hypothetical protein [Cupriavidus taiwanensis]SOZ45064.1 conserved membrane hypothetical protein [Cupriavidus taiwanensis]
MTRKNTFQLALPVVLAGGAIVATGGATLELWPGETAIAILALLAAVAVATLLASKCYRMSTLSVVGLLAGLIGIALVATASASWLCVLGGCLCCAAWFALRFDGKRRDSHAS